MENNSFMANHNDNQGNKGQGSQSGDMSRGSSSGQDDQMESGK